MKIAHLIKIENLIRKTRDIILKHYYKIVDKKVFCAKKYDMIFSLGINCITAKYMKEEGIREFSGPFDWLAGSDFITRFKIFSNNFENFFNKKDLVYIGQGDNDKPKDLYDNKRTNLTFLHDFPLNGNFSEDFPKIKEKYDRRISRINENVKSGKTFLIIFMDMYYHIGEKYKEEDIIQIVKEANEKYKQSKIDVLYIKHNAELKNGEYNIKNISENVIMAECFNEYEDKNQKIGNRKNILRILHFFNSKQYRF